MTGDNAAMEALEHRVLIPDVIGDKLLKRADGSTRGQSDRFDTLAGQFTHQPAAVSSQVLERRKTRKAFAKAAKVLGKRRPQVGNLLFGHRPPCLMEVLLPTGDPR